ncbi:hypothetical protein NQ317_006697 [Molorchus minor]|uniref:Uncharacterized protein n=1 Tax=Molorchus minor TaxID=1323400 RepID=A0ABQ9JUK4_9CUCU|nr:hypothetical protein NQ317_006697 [Molorchus minor]
MPTPYTSNIIRGKKEIVKKGVYIHEGQINKNSVSHLKNITVEHPSYSKQARTFLIVDLKSSEKIVFFLNKYLVIDGDEGVSFLITKLLNKEPQRLDTIFLTHEGDVINIKKSFYFLDRKWNPYYVLNAGEATAILKTIFPQYKLSTNKYVNTTKKYSYAICKAVDYTKFENFEAALSGQVAGIHNPIKTM